MENELGQNTLTAQNVRKQFDHTLGQHIECLTGTRYGVGALPVNLATISCIILLTERENEIDSYTSTSSERHTHETSNRGGKPILKCPRVTCRYWQKPPGEITEEHLEKDVSQAQEPDTLTAITRKPRRRVVRRRIVRRKR